MINVFKGGGLQNNELYTLNENIRYVAKLYAKSHFGVNQVVRWGGILWGKGKGCVQLPLLLPLEGGRCVSKVWNRLFWPAWMHVALIRAGFALIWVKGIFFPSSGVYLLCWILMQCCQLLQFCH